MAYISFDTLYVHRISPMRHRISPVRHQFSCIFFSISSHLSYAASHLSRAASVLLLYILDVAISLAPSVSVYLYDIILLLFLLVILEPTCYTRFLNGSTENGMHYCSSIKLCWIPDVKSLPISAYAYFFNYLSLVLKR